MVARTPRKPTMGFMTRTRTEEPTVAEVMTQVVVTIEPETTIPEVIELFRSRHISGAPVVSHEGEVLGVISTSDVLDAGDSRTALDIATRKVVAIDEDAPLSEAARLLLELGIRRLVVHRGDRIAGILTAT